MECSIEEVGCEASGRLNFSLGERIVGNCFPRCQTAVTWI
jgi:hypothetical protein